MKFVVTSSPHIRGKRNTQNIMRDVIIALIPTLAVGCVLFGFRALMVTILSILAAVASEFVNGNGQFQFHRFYPTH